MPLSKKQYEDQVYAGILGKLIGVYWGRPVEGWTSERIAEIGPFDTYIHDRLGVPLVVTDDDLSGTFTFPRALEDYGFRPTIGAAEIGETWLNYLIEGKTVLWWGGRGTSTEHTAFLNLQKGIPAPASGSIPTNGTTVAHQIGAMIFIDGWAMLCPGDPQAASRWARAAASVSHDGLAIDAAVAVAVMEAMAFVESDIAVLLDLAQKALPADSLVARLIGELKEWHTKEPDWRQARLWIEQNHGYDKYPGTCHAIPNFCLIIMALLWGEGDFRRSMSMVIAAGWDTDCNAGNLGCLLGIRGGTAAFESCHDLRSVPRDLVLLSSANGGVTDAARLAIQLIHYRERLAGQPAKNLAEQSQFSFPFPGAVHGFQADPASRLSPVTGVARGLRLDFGTRGSMKAPVFVAPREHQQPTYDFVGSPLVFPGQRLRAHVSVPQDGTPVMVRGFVELVDDEGTMNATGPETLVQPGKDRVLEWVAGGTSATPILHVGLDVLGQEKASLCLHSLSWAEVPRLKYGMGHVGQAWRSAWVSSLDRWWPQFTHPFHLVKNRGVGLLYQGDRSWKDYGVSAQVTGIAARRWGVVFRCQGLHRYLALTLEPSGRVALIRQQGSGHPTVLTEGQWSGETQGAVCLAVDVRGTQITATVNSELALIATEEQTELTGGAFGLLIDEGTLLCAELTIHP